VTVRAFTWMARPITLSAITLLAVAIPLMSLCLSARSGAMAQEAERLPVFPVPGRVTVVDIGSEKCLPCQLMAKMMPELGAAYQDRAAFVFIDVWKHREVMDECGIDRMPTQIFYDQEGEEIFRHEGFMAKKAIVEKLEQLGIKKIVP
jgi:thioredoxin 1